MFKIQNNKKAFYQWDTNQKILITVDCSEVHFTNDDEKALVVEVRELLGNKYVTVPNILLQEAKCITAYAYGGHTKYQKTFRVIARAKPEAYVYTETEVLNYTSLEKRVSQLEKGGTGSGGAVDPEVVEQLVDEYLAENPPAPGEPGKDGADGKDGKDGEDGYTPVRGVDYWTEADKAEIKAYVDEQMGDIETALDGIIAIQNGLIGDIAFSIDGVIYTALVGMTWGEWCDSEYNTIGAHIDETTEVVMIEVGYVAVYDPDIGDIDQLSNTVIIDKCNYYTY